MLERFAAPAREVVVTALAEAQDVGDPEVAPVHLLIALSAVDGDVATAALHELGLTADALRRGRGPVIDDADAEALRSVGIDVDELLARLEASLGPDALVPVPSTRRPRFSRAAKKTLELAVRETSARHDRVIGCQDVLVGVLRVGDAEVERVLAAEGVSIDDVEAALRRHRDAA